MEADRSAGAWDDVLRVHAAPARRWPVGLWLASVLVWLLLAALFAVERKWLSLVAWVPVTISTLRSRSRRLQAAPTTTVSGDGLLVHGSDRDRYLAWDQVLEVYPRAAWATWPTVRTPDGSTVSLPGVDDDAAARLEQFAAHLGVGR